MLCSSLNTEGEIERIAHEKPFPQFTVNDRFKNSYSALRIHSSACINMEPERSFSEHAITDMPFFHPQGMNVYNK